MPRGPVVTRRRKKKKKKKPVTATAAAVGTTTPPSSPTTGKPQVKAYPEWQYAFLQQLGIKPTPINMQFLSLWARSEGVSTAYHNPLAITDPYHNWSRWETPGYLTTAGVVKMDSETHAGIATAQFLQADTMNSNGYKTIIQALKSNNMVQMFRAVNASAWCRGCENNRYPIAAYGVLGSSAPAVGPRPQSSTTNTAAGASSGGSSSDSSASSSGSVLSSRPTATATSADMGATDAGTGSVGAQGPIGNAEAQGAGNDKIGCAGKPDAISWKIPLGPKVGITACNIKAISSGLILVAGLQTLFLGVVLIGVSAGLKTKVGQAALGAIPVAGDVAKAFGGSSASVKKLATGAKKVVTPKKPAVGA